MFAHPLFVFSNRILEEALTGPGDGSLLRAVLIAVYAAILVALSIYGGHRYLVLWRAWNTRKSGPVIPPVVADSELPGVTVQLPIFNEVFVVRRLIRTVAALDYPKDRFEIQVLDDSTDETQLLAREEVDRLRELGFQASYVHRTDRTGYKAGALENGLKLARYELLAIFDADFVPEKDFLRKLVPHFEDQTVGAVQARWTHLNEESSELTRLQALMLDGHFRLEHCARSRSGLFFNFNGTGGLWRRATIQDAGGWQHDTLTEDLDLSYRAQLKGWRFVYRDDVICPAELPGDMNAYKAQQHRWAKGSVQAMRKLVPRIWKSDLPIATKAEAFIHLTSNLCYLLAIPLLLMSLPMLLIRARIADGWLGAMIDQTVFACGTMSVLVFYAGTLVARGTWAPRYWHLPFSLLALMTGMAVNQARAVLEGFGRDSGEFVRTPKANLPSGKVSGKSSYRSAKSVVRWIEFGFALYFTLVMGVAIGLGLFGTIPFLSVFFCGFWYVCARSFLDLRPSFGGRTVPAETAVSS